MFDTIAALVPSDPDFPPRVRRLDLYRRMLDGTIYDVLPFSFHEERGAGGEYIPLRNRRPSVRYPLPRIVVDDSLSLVFGEGHFPTIDCADRPARAALADIAREANLNGVMLQAAVSGSVGSVAVLMRVLRGRVFFRVLDSVWLTPAWDPEVPDELIGVTERYKVRGATLMQQGYAGLETTAEYWFERRWDADAETWLLPVLVRGGAEPVVDAERTVRHGLGFVPVVWVRNLPCDRQDDVDGACTFARAIETTVEIDYQLSQAGRALKYSADPTLLIREPAASEAGDLVRGAANALVVGERGDARLLEINGAASAAVIEYVRTLRELALEGVHGNRASPEKLSGAQSGRALELMNQGLIWLADNLRVSYGAAMLRLARMVVLASNIYPLRTHGERLQAIDPTVRLGLIWPRWYAPSAEDRQRDAQTLTTLVRARQLSRETAVKVIADSYDIEDVAAELARIDGEDATMTATGDGDEDG